MDPHDHAAQFRIGEWLVDTPSRQVCNGQVSHTLSPRAIRVLASLMNADGRVVSRETLLSEVWPGVIVTDESLTQAVSELRRALRSGRESVEIIGTVPKAGYRLLSNVETCAQPSRPHDSATPAMAIEAYTLVLDARRALIRGDQNAVGEAVRLCREAVLISPRSAVAQAQLAISLVHLGLYGGGAVADLHEALHTANESVRYGPNSSFVHAACGFALSSVGQSDAASRAFTRCFELGDADGEAHYLAARASFADGRFRSATALALKASDLVADVPRPLILAARAASRIDNVLACNIANSCRLHLERRLATDPSEPRSRYSMGPVLALLSEKDAALDAISRCSEPGSLCTMGNVFAYALIGECDAGLSSLEEAIDGGYRDVRWLNHEPTIDNLKKETRFGRITRNLEAA